MCQSSACPSLHVVYPAVGSERLVQTYMVRKQMDSDPGMFASDIFEMLEHMKRCE